MARRSRPSILQTLVSLLLAPAAAFGFCLLNTAGAASTAADTDDGKGDDAGGKPDDKGGGARSDGASSADAAQAALREERAARARAEREAKAARKELDDLKAASATDQEKAILKAKEEGKAEALKAANEKLIRAEIKSAAAGKLSDPSDAVRLLDQDDFVSDEGDVDEKKLAKAIEGLLKAKPYLAAKGRGPGDGGGGPRGRPAGASMDDWIRGQAAGRR